MSAMIYFPFSDLCPHCGNQLIFESHSILVCYNSAVPITDENTGGDWLPYNVYINLSESRIARIVYRIEDYVILWLFNFVNSPAETTILKIDPEYWDGFTDLREIFTSKKILWLGDWQQPNLIKEKINTLLLLQ